MEGQDDTLDKDTAKATTHYTPSGDTYATYDTFETLHTAQYQYGPTCPAPGVCVVCGVWCVALAHLHHSVV